MFQRIRKSVFWIKLTHWEYWSFHALYAPLYPYWIWLCIRAQTSFFINTANPHIKNGGFLMESKKEIYDLIPIEYYPITLLVEPETNFEIIVQQVQQLGLEYPLIAKPDIGMRGIAVKKISSLEELSAYAAKNKMAYLIQSFVSYEREVGIFYVRLPFESKGKITGIVSKEFLNLTGDGQSTVLALMQKNDRAILQIPYFEKFEPTTLTKVIAKDEELLLSPYGNHARGAKFIDITALNSPGLTDAINQICLQIPEFYFGRLDIKFQDWESLCQGKNLSIIELNGAGSEPTHIYDPKHSVFFAWAEIIRHWKMLQQISIYNHLHQKIPYMGWKKGIKMLKENHHYIQQLEASQ